MIKKISKIILSFFEQKAFPIFFIVNLLRGSLISFKVMRLGKKNHINTISWPVIQKKKKSDRLYILGSGSSVSDISKTMWKDIKKNDSFGFNFWLIHEHIPDYYMFEPPRIKETRDILIYWLEKRKKDFDRNNTLLLIKDIEVGDMELSECDGLLPNYSFLIKKDTFCGKSESSFKKSILYVKKLGLHKRNVIYFKRASLFLAVYFGWKAGYKEIVLVGVDLNNTKYFYEHEKYANDVVPASGQSGVIHKTISPEYGYLAVDKSLIILNEDLLIPSGVKLFVTNKKSILYPHINFFGSSAKPVGELRHG